jgi:hypothetical protein
MGQSPSWEVNSHPGSQETLHLLWNPKIHYHVDKGPPLFSWSKCTQSTPSHPISIRSIYIQVLWVVSHFHVFQPEFCMHFSSCVCLLHAPLISSSLIFITLVMFGEYPDLFHENSDLHLYFSELTILSIISVCKYSVWYLIFQVRLYDPSTPQRRPVIDMNIPDQSLTTLTVTNRDQ